MLSLILSFLFLSSAGVFSAVLGKFKYEEVLPLTCTSCVLILLIFGVPGHLLEGVYFLLMLFCLILVLSAIVSIKRMKNDGTVYFLNTFCRRFFSPGFFVFFFLFLFFLYIDTGTVLTKWDEFTHWGTSVKQMFFLNQLPTSPEMKMVFYKSYPPAMPLFQYFFEKLHALLSQEPEFSEWRLSFYYHIFLTAYIVPFLHHIDWKHLSPLLFVPAIFLVPMAVYPEAYSLLSVDQFLGVVAGAGMAGVFTANLEQEKRRKIDCAFILATIAIVSLTKSAGILFSVFIALALCCKANVEVHEKTKRMIIIAAAFASLLLPNLLWALCMKIANVQDDSTLSVSPQLILNLVSGKDQYRRDIFVSFLVQLKDGIACSISGIRITYSLYLSAASGCVILLGYRMKRKSAFPVCLLTVVSLLMYLIGLVMTYLYHFSEVEARVLASFSRYIGASLLFISVFILCICCNICSERREKGSILPALLVLSVVVLSVPYNSAKDIITRKQIDSFNETRYDYDVFCDGIKQKIGHHANIYFLDQGGNGYSFLVCRWNFMPNDTNPGSYMDPGGYKWSIVPPEIESNRWARYISPEEWRNELANNYDYVVVYHADENLMRYYGSIFDTVHNRSLYRVNKESGGLSLVTCIDY